ncbi:hypothetical protein SAMD00019534_045990, partial [Acytostelium subglobosum LB1]|uniref:hypothetical protein n=1 Tax=Acytostelium subglobosum LB1 TaxID=1410327 RepID=UPI000644FCC6
QVQQQEQTTSKTKRIRNRGVFHFKHYPIYQEHCGQKVGTDALLIAGYTSIARFQPKQSLDIGTGSGVLSIMLAQRFNRSVVHSIDIDETAIKQASINIDSIYNSGQAWARNIFVFHTPIQLFAPATQVTATLEKNSMDCNRELVESHMRPSDGLYDLIISAPPYFPSDVKLDQFVSAMPDNRRIARHTHTLTMEELVVNVLRLLRPGTGRFTTIVSLPQPDDDLIIAANNHGMVMLEQVDVTDCPGSKIVRRMYTFRAPEETATANETIKQTFAIYETSMKESKQTNHRKHSNQYKWMLNDFCDHFQKEVQYEQDVSGTINSSS